MVGMGNMIDRGKEVALGEANGCTAGEGGFDYIQ